MDEIRHEEEGSEEGHAAQKVKRGRGRPKGSKNRPKVQARPVRNTPKRAFLVGDDEMDVYWRKG